MRRLPQHVSLRLITRYDDGERFHHVWWVRLTLTRTSGPIRTFPIRRQTIFDRPYTQKEREFKEACRRDGGIPVIGRLSAYFSDDPQFGKMTPIAKDKSAVLIDAVKKALDQQDLSGLLNLYHWEHAEDETRNYVRSEMSQLLRRKVESVNVVPKRFGGKLHHWQAFQTFDPNLPVLGYLVFAFSPNDGQQHEARSLWLELGMRDGQLRLVNYVEKSFSPPREEFQLEATAHLEPLSDSTYEHSWTIKSPEIFVSARMANQEVWLMTKKGKIPGSLAK